MIIKDTITEYMCTLLYISTRNRMHDHNYNYYVIRYEMIHKINHNIIT